MPEANRKTPDGPSHDTTRRKRPTKQPPRPRGDEDASSEDTRSPGSKPHAVTTVPEETQPAEERGERIATGKAIARSGGSKGFVPGATEQDVGGKSGKRRKSGK